MGGLENKHWTDVESTNRVCASVRAFTLKVSHAPITVRVLVINHPPASFTLTLRLAPIWVRVLVINDHPAAFDLRVSLAPNSVRVLVINDPPASFTLKVSHAPISVRVLVINDPFARGPFGTAYPNPRAAEGKGKAAGKAFMGFSLRKEKTRSTPMTPGRWASLGRSWGGRVY